MYLQLFIRVEILRTHKANFIVVMKYVRECSLTSILVLKQCHRKMFFGFYIFLVLLVGTSVFRIEFEMQDVACILAFFLLDTSHYFITFHSVFDLYLEYAQIIKK